MTVGVSYLLTDISIVLSISGLGCHKNKQTKTIASNGRGIYNNRVKTQGLLTECWVFYNK